MIFKAFNCDEMLTTADDFFECFNKLLEIYTIDEIVEHNFYIEEDHGDGEHACYYSQGLYSIYYLEMLNHNIYKACFSKGGCEYILHCATDEEALNYAKERVLEEKSGNVLYSLDVVDDLMGNTVLREVYYDEEYDEMEM